MAGALAAAHAGGGKTGLNCVDFIVRSCSTKNVNWLFCFAAPGNRDRRVRGFGLGASRPSRNAPQQNRERILPFAYGGRRMGFLRKIARFRLTRSIDRRVLLTRSVPTRSVPFCSFCSFRQYDAASRTRWRTISRHAVRTARFEDYGGGPQADPAAILI